MAGSGRPFLVDFLTGCMPSRLRSPRGDLYPTPYGSRAARPRRAAAGPARAGPDPILVRSRRRGPSSAAGSPRWCQGVPFSMAHARGRSSQAVSSGVLVRTRAGPAPDPTVRLASGPRRFRIYASLSLGLLGYSGGGRRPFQASGCRAYAHPPLRGLLKSLFFQGSSSGLALATPVRPRLAGRRWLLSV